MELKEGMYVRDIHGQIDKIIGFKGALIEFEKDLMGGYIDSNDFTKASFDILDLIEEGDLLEIEYFSLRYEERVTKLFEVTYLDKRNIVFENSVHYFILRNKEFSKKDKGLKPIIKRIITKEQLDSVAYKIGE